eukprot:XP_024455386.1 probable carboxylesterase 120 [Populus trichocarpa]
MSVEYRLAPERRLPAASDDAIEATHFIKKNEVWFKEHADYSSCYVMGQSDGGFSGAIRTKFESLSIDDDPVIPLAVNDLLWYHALPLGAAREHEFCNPTVGGGSKLMDRMKLIEWSVMVI